MLRKAINILKKAIIEQNEKKNYKETEKEMYSLIMLLLSSSSSPPPSPPPPRSKIEPTKTNDTIAKWERRKKMFLKMQWTIWFGLGVVIIFFCFLFRFPLATIFTITQKKGNSLNEKKGKTRISMQIYSVQTKWNKSENENGKKIVIPWKTEYMRTKKITDLVGENITQVWADSCCFLFFLCLLPFL